MPKVKTDSKVKKSSRNNDATNNILQQFGLQIPNFDDPELDDADYEVELMNIDKSTDLNRNTREKNGQNKTGAAAQPDLESFQKDVNKLLVDIDRPINDDELSDYDEEKLLAGLDELVNEEPEENCQLVDNQSVLKSNSGEDQTILSTLEERRVMYIDAIKTANANNESSKARRYDRQLKVIQDLILSTKNGQRIDENEIPPSLNAPEPSATSTGSNIDDMPVQQTSKPKLNVPLVTQSVASGSENKPVNPSTSEEIQRLEALALEANRTGDKVKALEYMAKRKALLASDRPVAQTVSATTESTIEENEAELAMPLKAPEPKTILEALQQRHEELSKRHKQALQDQEPSKARRMDRLVKEFERAIIATKRKESYDYSELPDIPGFAPIPLLNKNASGTGGASEMGKPVAPPMASRKNPEEFMTKPNGRAVGSNVQVKPNGSSVPVVNQQRGSKSEFKSDRNLDNSEAASTLISNPNLLSAAVGYEVINLNSLDEELRKCSPIELQRRLEQDLLNQIQLCARNQQLFAQMGGNENVKLAAEYKILEKRCSQDLEKLKQSAKNGSTMPEFHYEKREMKVIDFNEDIPDHQVVVQIIRAINIPIPSGYSAEKLETFVTIEFPYPQEAIQKAQTRSALGAKIVNYPQEQHNFTIKRTDTKLLRSIGRKELKCSIFYKAGLFRSARLLGTASLELANLRNSATIHESVDIFTDEHKKKAEGKLEVKLRIREGLEANKKTILVTSKWLFIDGFVEIRKSESKSPFIDDVSSKSVAAGLFNLKQTSELLTHLFITEHDENSDCISSKLAANPDEKKGQQPFTSIELLKYQSQLMSDAFENFEVDENPEKVDQYKKNIELLNNRAEQIQKSLDDGGEVAVKKYIHDLENLCDQLKTQETDFEKQNQSSKVITTRKKRNIVLTELKQLTEKEKTTPEIPFEPEILEF